MSSPPTIERFKGASWEECEDFIRAILEVAWKEDKTQDPRWIAGFASFHFSGKALSWYSRLPQDIREDWVKLQVALLDRWPSPEDEDEPRIEPTPAAAASLNRSDRADRPLQGALKIISDGSTPNYYLKLGLDSRGMVTTNVSEAIRIRCNSLSNTTILERIDGSCHSWLAIQWLDSTPNLNNGSTAYGILVLVDSLTLKTAWDATYPYQLASCTLSADGEVIPFWETSDTSKISIGIFHDSSGALWVAADPHAYSRRYSNEQRVKLFIEPID